jgi:hypothetical protein
MACVQSSTYVSCVNYEASKLIVELFKHLQVIAHPVEQNEPYEVTAVTFDSGWQKTVGTTLSSIRK